MDQPTPPSDNERGRKRRQAVRKAGKKAARLTGREYLPMALTLAFWLVVALAIGHADAARLLAASVLLRAPLMLSQMSVGSPLRQRIGAPAAVMRSALGTAALIQAAVLLAVAAQLVLLLWLLWGLGQPLIALLLLYTATGVPARLVRAMIPTIPIRLNRLILAASGLACGGLAFALAPSPEGFALAFGAREWLATLLASWIGPRNTAGAAPIEEPLTLAEVAKHSVVTSRRLLTYRLTKNILTVLGPFGNFAARTGRGFNLHNRLERHVPHKRGGFVAFALLTAVIAALLIWKSGEPLAMIGAAGAVQLSALAINVLLWWRFLPVRDDPTLRVDEDDDE
jgi:hypothetical protein